MFLLFTIRIIGLENVHTSNGPTNKFMYYNNIHVWIIIILDDIFTLIVLLTWTFDENRISEFVTLVIWLDIFHFVSAFFFFETKQKHTKALLIENTIWVLFLWSMVEAEGKSRRKVVKEKKKAKWTTNTKPYKQKKLLFKCTNVFQRWPSKQKGKWCKKNNNVTTENSIAIQMLECSSWAKCIQMFHTFLLIAHTK